MTPGIYDMPAADYHADPCPAPSLSSGIGHTLVTRSPLHAWSAHPRHPDFERDEPTAEQEEGTALHALILENRAQVEVIDAPDWRTKAAQEARKAARAAGKVPILLNRWMDLRKVEGASRQQLSEHEAAPILHQDYGRPEQTLIWQEHTKHGSIWCRARADWWPNNGVGWIGDLKTVSGSADPGAWGKKMATEGPAFQAAFYVRGARALGFGGIEGMRFVVVERDAPFALSVCEAAPTLAEFAYRQVAEAIETWAACLHAGEWPGYADRVAYVDLPGWLEFQWADRDLRREQAGKPKPFYMPSDKRVVNSGAPFA